MVDLNSHFAGQVAELQLNTTSPFILRYGNYTAGCFTVDTAGGNSYHRRAWTTIPYMDNVTNTLFSLTLNLNYTVSQSLSVNNIDQHCITYIGYLNCMMHGRFKCFYLLLCSVQSVYVVLATY